MPSMNAAKRQIVIEFSAFFKDAIKPSIKRFIVQLRSQGKCRGVMDNAVKILRCKPLDMAYYVSPVDDDVLLRK